MPYYIDAAKVTLDALLSRIKETDLVPSRAVLRDEIDDHFNKLKINGILTLSELRKAVKNPKSIDTLAAKTGIGVEYLTLLRREVEGYFPKASPLSDFTWLDQCALTALSAKGYKDAASLYNAVEASGKEKIFGVGNSAFSAELSSLVSLTRIQWVSPLTAKMLFDAGYKTVKSVASADAQELCRSLEEINTGNKYFKGKIGLRDIRRLIKAAFYVDDKT
jgi:hypothetical protein